MISNSVTAYQAMKNSGVVWLGDIPAHWQVKQLKHLFVVRNGATPSSGEGSYWDGEIIWITPDDLGSNASKEISNSRRHLTIEGYRSCGTTLVPPGSLVLSTRAPIGHLGIAETELCTNQGCRSLVFHSEGDPRYYYYWLVAAKPELQSWGQGSTFLELATGKLSTIKACIPPIFEQQNIAKFLDREIGKIDLMIAQKERLINLQQEKRHSIISHAVTKGIKPNAQMKESGIPAVGLIPVHWQVTRNKQTFFEVNERSTNGDEELLTVSHLTGVTPRSEKDVNMFLAESTEGYKLCRQNDMVVNTMWAYMGALGVTRYDGIVSPSYNVYRLKSGFMPEYIDMLYRSKPYICEITRYSKGIWQSRLRLYPEEFLGLSTLTPPIEEQKDIVAHIEKENAGIDELIKKLNESIGQLREYRISVISAAVTGKIDVREAIAI